MKNINFISLPNSYNCVCDLCPKARQARLPFPISQISSSHVFDLIHVDTWGPNKVPTHDYHRYFVTIDDDFSRGTQTFLLSNKSIAFTVLQGFLNIVERQFNTRQCFKIREN